MLHNLKKVSSDTIGDIRRADALILDHSLEEKKKKRKKEKKKKRKKEKKKKRKKEKKKKRKKEKKKKKKKKGRKKKGKNPFQFHYSKIERIPGKHLGRGHTFEKEAIRPSHTSPPKDILGRGKEKKGEKRRKKKGT